jgi:hypothetical protein
MKTILSILLLLSLACLCAAQNKSLFVIRQKAKTGYIDNTGKIVIQPKFDSGDDFNEGVAAVRSGDSWGYIDETGKFIIQPQFFEANQFREGTAKVGVYYKNRQIIKNVVGYYKYIDKNGRFVKESESKKLKIDFFEGLSSLYSDEGCGYIDKNGNVAFNRRFTMCGEFSEGLAAVYADGKWGFIDKTGKYMIEPQFGEASSFNDGISIVKMLEIPKNFEGQGSYSLIDKAGHFIFPARFGQIGKFRDGLAYVTLDGNYYLHGFGDKWGYINRQGKIVWNSF